MNAASSRLELDDGKCIRGAEVSPGSIMKSRGLQLLAGCISYYYRRCGESGGMGIAAQRAH